MLKHQANFASEVLLLSQIDGAMRDAPPLATTVPEAS
jgi:hypothetical protein